MYCCATCVKTIELQLTFNIIKLAFDLHALQRDFLSDNNVPEWLTNVLGV
jgi:hypothetical protein